MKVCVICKKLATLCKFWKDLYTFLSVWYCPQRPTIKKDQIQDRKKENNRGLLTISNWLIQKPSYVFGTIYIIVQNCFITNLKLFFHLMTPIKQNKNTLAVDWNCPLSIVQLSRWVKLVNLVTWTPFSSLVELLICFHLPLEKSISLPNY